MSDVFVRGANNDLYQRTKTGGWTGWSQPRPGSCLKSAPTASTWSASRIDVFYRGCDNVLYHAYTQNAGANWTNYSVSGTCLRSPPAAVSWGSGRLDVVYRGCDDGIWHHDKGSGAWQVQGMGSCTMTAPAIASWGSTKLDVFHRGCGPAGDGEGVFHTSSSNGTSWSGWAARGGCLASGPGADAWAPDWLDAPYRGCDYPAGLYEAYWNGGSWYHFDFGIDWP